MKKEVVTPYNKESSKKEQVAEMFNNIAGNYDFLNHFLSMGIDILWRKKAIRILGKDNPQHIVDIATRTGDFGLEALSIAPQKITGIDISEKMLEVGREKMKKKKVDHIVEMKLGDSENLPLASDSVDAVTVSFGVRNFENLEKGLAEMHRILKPGCKTVIIEFSKPENFPIKQLYNFYFLNILPAIGKLVSKDPRAYTYLPESVNAFPYGKKFIGIMDKVGYKNVRAIPLTFGIASIYIGEK